MLVTPVLESVVPARERPGPIVVVLRAPVPLPIRSPVKVVEPVPPCATESDPAKRLKPILVVATTDPFALVERRELVRLVIANVVLVALVKLFDPVKELLSERREEEAALTVIAPPKETGEPLIVREPLLTRSPLPIVVVATSLPFTSVARREFVSEVKKVVPEFVNCEVDAFAN